MFFFACVFVHELCSIYFKMCEVLFCKALKTSHVKHQREIDCENMNMSCVSRGKGGRERERERESQCVCMCACVCCMCVCVFRM